MPACGKQSQYFTTLVAKLCFLLQSLPAGWSIPDYDLSNLGFLGILTVVWLPCQFYCITSWVLERSYFVASKALHQLCCCRLDSFYVVYVLFEVWLVLLDDIFEGWPH